LPYVATTLPQRCCSVANKLPTSAFSLAQDGGKLEPGAFYLDRRPQHKHLALAGTKYSAADVDALWIKLEGMAAPAMPAPAPTA
jgi:dehydrogenase/reductase SDR family protein 12